MKKFAMVFAAGKGTRLGTITQHTPKALVQIAGKPLIFHIIKKLHKFGFTDIVVNVHHHSQQMFNFLQNLHFEDCTIFISDETEMLLDTGGGFKHAEHFFENAENILLHNVDIISNINLNNLWDAHCNSNNIATLAIQHRTSTRYFLFDEQLLLKGWKNTSSGEIILHHPKTFVESLAFSGIHVVSKKIFNLLPDERIFSMTDAYIAIAKNYPVKGYIHDSDLWIDVGKPEQLAMAENILLNT